MKNLLLLATLLTLASCGAVNEMCGSDLRMGCNTIFGELPKEYDEEISQLEKKNKEQDETISELQAILEALSQRVDYVEIELESTQSAVSNNSVNITQLTQNMQSVENDLTELENFELVSVIYPCVGAKEILIKLGDGKLLAYFEVAGNGNSNVGRKAYLSVLGNGNYRTTDGTGCQFRVNNGEVTEL